MNHSEPLHPFKHILPLLFVLFLAACSPTVASPQATSTLAVETATPLLASPVSSLSPSPTSTSTITPTPTPEFIAGHIPILEYHNSTFNMEDQVMMTPEWFDEQMKWLHDNGFSALSAEELAAYLDGQAFPPNSVVLTFDIGPAPRVDYINDIIPTLRKYGLKAIFFVLTNAIDEVCSEKGLVCWDDLRQWSAEGIVSVASHGVTHQDYRQLTADEQILDAGKAKQIIEEKIGLPVIGFAYPYDGTNAGAMQVVQSLGYQFAVSGYSRQERYVLPNDPGRFSLPRLYPYSNRQIYPALVGWDGQTFPQVMEAHIEPVKYPGTPPNTPETATPASALLSPREYYEACESIDREVNTYQRQYLLDTLAPPLDVSVEAQSYLELPVIFKASCNARLGNSPNAIVIHATRGGLTASLSEFQERGKASAHYVIDRNGQIYQMVPEGLVAFHITCCLGPGEKVTEDFTQSIGIELVNKLYVNPKAFEGPIFEDYLESFGYRYWEDYPAAQIAALVVLVEDISARWGIPPERIIGHYRVNDNADPGPALNLFWQRNGYPPRGPIFHISTPEPDTGN